MDIEFYLGDRIARRNWPAVPRIGDLVQLVELGDEQRKVTNVLWADNMTIHVGPGKPGLVVRIELGGVRTIKEVRTGTKLKIEQVRQIRQMLAEGHSQKEISKKFGVTVPSICNIAVGRSWRGVE